MTASLENRRVVLAKRPKGVPRADHFAVEDGPVPALGEDQFLVECEYWSVDPAMRGWVNDAPNYLPPVEIGATMRSLAVGEIVDSRHPDYEEGDRVSGWFGWQRFAVSDGSNVDRSIEERDLPASLESVRRLYAGLQSFRSMSRMDASLMKASALRLRFSLSLASRRQRLSQAMVRSTTQRLGWTTKPFTRSDRLTISVSRSGRMPARAR